MRATRFDEPIDKGTPYEKTKFSTRDQVGKRNARYHRMSRRGWMGSIMIDHRRAVGSPSFEYLVGIVGESRAR